MKEGKKYFKLGIVGICCILLVGIVMKLSININNQDLAVVETNVEKNNENGISRIATEHEKEWLLDLEVIRTAYPQKAKGFYEHLSEEEWNQGIDEIKRAIQEEKLSDLYITYKINSLLASAKILHISFQCGYTPDEYYFPIIPRRTEDGVYYLEGAAKAYEAYLGCEIKDINGYKCNEIGEALDTLHPSENMHQVEIMYAMYGISKDEMTYLGMSSGSNDCMTIITQEGKEEKVALTATEDPFSVQWVHYEDRYNQKWISRSIPNNAYPGFWYKLDQENRVFYFNYSECQDAETNGDSSMPYFRDFTQGMMQAMKESDQSFNKLVIDLRYNHGGDSELINRYFIRPNKDFLMQKKIYVLIGEQTFSAGLDAANDLDRNFDVVFIGQETGGIVGGYTNQYFEQLEHTKSVIGYCRSEATYPELEKRENQIIGKGIMPDYLISDKYEDISSSVDRAYEKVLEE